MSRRVQRLAVMILLPTAAVWGMLLVLWWRRQTRVASPEYVAPAPTRKSPSKADDLKRLHGVGPKTAGALQAAGILTYTQLAKKTPDQLRDILSQAGVRAAGVETWPDQAKLASAGKWEDLEAKFKG